jgi:hypothetical protein
MLGHVVDRAIKFREPVAQDFEGLVRDGIQVDDLLELREVQLDASLEK